MKVYYQDDLVTLYHGDALDKLASLSTDSVHAVVTDPPYIIGAVSSGGLNSKSGGWADMMNSSLWFTAWYREVGRILKHDGSFWTFLNWRTLPVVTKAAMDARLPMTSMMVWDKQWIGPGGNQGLRPAYEMCALMAQPGFSIENRGIPDVWQHKVGSYKATGHPAEKPAGLVGRILDTAGLEPGQTVVEPFSGSGTTAVAAKQRGLRCIAVEAEERFCEMAARRLSQGTLDLGGVA
jgi:DNA modification methylase